MWIRLFSSTCVRIFGSEDSETLKENQLQDHRWNLDTLNISQIYFFLANMLTWRLSTGQAYAIVCCNSQSEHNPHLVVTCSTAASFLKIGCIASQTRINEPDCCAGQRTAEKLHGRRDNLRHFRRISNVIHCHLRHSDYVLMCFHWCGSFHL